MDKFKMGNDKEVILKVAISSEALVGSNVKLDKKIIKKSAVYNFDAVLGNSNDISNKKLNVAINCFVEDNIEQVMHNTIVDFSLSDGENSQNYEGQKLKIDDEFFIIFYVVKLTKS